MLADQLLPLLPAGVNITWRGMNAAELSAAAAAAADTDTEPWWLDDALNPGAPAAAAEETLDTLRVVVMPAAAGSASEPAVLFGRYSDVLVSAGVPPRRLAAELTAVALGAEPASAARRRVSTAPAYDLLISVVAPEPAAAPRWDGATAARLLRPAVAALRPLAQLSVRSQQLYHAGLGVSPASDSDTGEYYLTQQQLALAVTPLEARLGAAAVPGPGAARTLHFVVFVPPKNSRPLRLRPAAAGAVDAFISPRWGGVQVYNPAADESQLDVRRVCSVIAAQLRLLLGLPDSAVAARPAGAAVLRRWELATLRRRRTADSVDTARRNLASLAAMLRQISNIVISDAVAAAVADGVQEAEAAAALLAAGRDAEAYSASCRALANSERAIFDPSMLALLYFPDDQKYAVYIPLFLPVSIPVLMSLRRLWDWLRGRPEKVKTA